MPSGQRTIDLPAFSEPTSFAMTFGGGSQTEVVSAPLRLMPQTSLAFEYHDYIVAELGGTIVNYFQALGTCPVSMSNQLLKDLANPKHKRAPH